MSRWAVVLAGGQGVRLRPLTRLIAGDDRPKQFCALLSRETLLEQTLRRAALAIDPASTLVVVTRAHARFYVPLLAALPPRELLIQPQDRGTAPAILCALGRIARRAPMAPVAIIPSDHWVAADAAFMGHVLTAFAEVERRAELVVLLGITPDGPEVDYGWIEPAEAISPGGLKRVRRFWEKPPVAVAESLAARGCLWNSFVMVARVSALSSVIRAALPDLDAAFAAAFTAFGDSAERSALKRLYARLPSLNFSEQVLARPAANLAVLPVTDVAWSDWGQPRRVLATLARLGIRPGWADRAKWLA